MKILYIPVGDSDYTASTFEENFSGQKVSDLIARVEKGETLTYSEDDDDVDLEAQVFDFGDIDPKFIDFVRTEVQDYDSSKHSNFYLDGQIVGF